MMTSQEVRRRLDPSERRRRVIAAATRLFARRGYDRVTMDDIASAAGVTKPVLYDHFASKQALFRHLLESVRDHLLTKGAAVTTTSRRREDRFRFGVDAFFAFVERQPDSARVLLLTPQRDPIAARLSRNVQAGTSAGLAALLESYWPSAEPWRRAAAAEFVKRGMHAMAEWWLGHPDVSRDSMVEIVMQACWRGLREAGASHGKDVTKRTGKQ
jgi:AcrR family transcriptional regulator